jgi:hypothetical protein
VPSRQLLLDRAVAAKAPAGLVVVDDVNAACGAGCVPANDRRLHYEKASTHRGV